MERRKEKVVEMGGQTGRGEETPICTAIPLKRREAVRGSSLDEFFPKGKRDGIPNYEKKKERETETGTGGSQWDHLHYREKPRGGAYIRLVTQH